MRSGAEAAGVRRMADAVQYQDGAVVSRPLLKKETGSVTLFAFDRSQSLSEHTTPADALVHVLEGEAEVRISGVPHRLTEGDMIVLPADQPHAVEAVRRFKMVLTLIRR
jgi:quercetin dioxygenase-like cupin family protein